MTITTFTRHSTAITVCLLLISACVLPMEELIDEALMTGEWSKVEQRESAALRRQVREQSIHCEQDEVGYCKVSGRLSKRVCSCESHADVMSLLQQTQMSDDL